MNPAKKLRLLCNDELVDQEVDEESYSQIIIVEEDGSLLTETSYQQLIEPEPTQQDSQSNEGEQSFKWTHDATMLLLELRLNKENEFNRPICKKKKLWRNIAAEMEKIGKYKLTAEMCDLKFRNLLATYKKKMKKKQSGGEAITWEFFELIDSVLGCKAAIVPPKETVGTVDNIAKEDNNESNTCVSRASSAASAGPSGKKNNNAKEYNKEMSLNTYLQEKIKFEREYRERKDQKDKEKWKKKVELKEREIEAIEALTRALANKYNQK